MLEKFEAMEEEVKNEDKDGVENKRQGIRNKLNIKTKKKVKENTCE